MMRRKRPKVGAVLVQCASNVYAKHWQEVRKVVVTEAPRRKPFVIGRVYRQRPTTGTWDEYVGELQCDLSTLWGAWDEYEEAQA